MGGIPVLLQAMWRLVLRADRGVPPQPEGGSDLKPCAGGIGHIALYGVMLIARIIRIVAWFGLNGAAGEVHEWLKPAYILLIAAHVMTAPWHQFWKKDGLLLRALR